MVSLLALTAGKRTINGVIHRALAWGRADAQPARVWAIVDGARDLRVYSTVTQPGARAICLYGDDVPNQLARVAPWLVPVPPESSFGSVLATIGRNVAWGVMLRSDADRTAVAEHFAGLLRAMIPGGRTVLFRFYDPRVLRAYLPTCTAQELAQVFGPNEAFLIEQGDGQQREYVREHGALVIREPHWQHWID